MALAVNNPPANAGEARDAGLIPPSGRPPGGEHSNPLQYSCLESPMDRGALQATIHGVTLSQTQLKRLSTQQACMQLGKAMWQLNEESICFLGKRGKCCHCDPLLLFFFPWKLCNAWSYSSLWGPSSCDDKGKTEKTAEVLTCITELSRWINIINCLLLPFGCLKKCKPCLLKSLLIRFLLLECTDHWYKQFMERTLLSTLLY